METHIHKICIDDKINTSLTKKYIILFIFLIIKRIINYQKKGTSKRNDTNYYFRSVRMFKERP